MPKKKESKAKIAKRRRSRKTLTALSAALDGISGKGDFACGGPTRLPTSPALYIRNHGLVGLPLSVKGARELAKSPNASRAPFGKGEETVVDTSVRCAWQFEPKDVDIRNPFWADELSKLVTEIGFILGAGYSKIKPVLYKVLLYEKGGFFKAHRDTEKGERMFATLVVQLPSEFEGGELVVTHEGEKRTL
eukprot:Plantae.Rhodophyta-Hildenbrandia_rubra.ctg13508.p2 GENE.Plantae.Rhodophyta-Hildenbrandia_rubra.ctg13508~~Plantae.Rhodophyta-Hildenbrandia_rubra.ctg13508.p2  ORF type:complete len:191 (+),score=39.20 Plantae.Rhodophyta-Hildenbrandia_rubra.ctg13508:439-1011(+)